MNAAAATTIAATSEVLAYLSATYSTMKVTADDIHDSDDIMHAVANEYAAQYTGTFPFMLNMQQIQIRGWAFTDAQIAGIVNAAISDYRYATKKAPAPIVQSSTPTVAATEQTIVDGWYTIVGPQGGHRTLRITTISAEDKGNGVRQWVAYLCGPDNSGDYKTVGTLDGSTFSLFRKNEGKYADIVAAIKFLVRSVAKLDEYGRQYAIRSGRCYSCNRRLTTPESVARSLGPICAEKRDG